MLGLGKFGGGELGYASDIEVMFVYGDAGRTGGKNPIENSEYFERLGQELLQWIEAKQEGIFHLDVRLRPHGGKGSLTNPFDEIIKYYGDRGLAAPFERQSLIKLRHVAGDAALGKRVEAHRDHYVYSGKPWDLRPALNLRRQQLKELVERGTVNLKHSPGGIVDIEYAVQYLQIMHGHKLTALRTSNTMQALAALIDRGLVTRQDGEDLRKAYFSSACSSMAFAWSEAMPRTASCHRSTPMNSSSWPVASATRRMIGRQEQDISSRILKITWER